MELNFLTPFRQRIELGVGCFFFQLTYIHYHTRQLTAADINFSIIRPLVNKYARLRNMATVYVCLVVRSYFLTEAETDLAFANLMLSRANMCEIMAMKLLSRFATDHIQLVAVLTTTWNPLAGANRNVIQEVKQIINARDDDMGSAYDQSAIEVWHTSLFSFLLLCLTELIPRRWRFPRTPRRSLHVQSLKRSLTTFIQAV